MDSLVVLGKIEVASTLAMFGVIWIVQLVHYPSFAYVQKDNFPAFEAFHAKQISCVVLPLMLLELASHVALNFLGDRTLLRSFGTGLLVVIWAVTFFLSVPCHNKLARGFDERVWKKLVRTNWLRTGAWSLRALLVLEIF